MANIRLKAAAIGPGGVAAATGALALILLMALPLNSRLSAPATPILLIVWALTAAIIVLLSRLRMPMAVRAPLIAGLIGTALALAGIADLFGAKAVTRQVTDGIDAAERAQGEAVRIAGMRSGGLEQAGARVRLTPSPAGDDGWAGTINGALDGRIRGLPGQAFAITGDVNAPGGAQGAPRIVVAWSIVSGAIAVRCGVTSISGVPADGGAARIADQLAMPFGEAISRSFATGHVGCP